MIKKLGKAFLYMLLEHQVKRLRASNDFKIVTVSGSVGKTTTKLAIAKTLSSKARVCYQDGNYNDRLTVPLVLFGETEPAIFDIKAWLRLLKRTGQKSKQKFEYDYAVLELGSDAPGQIEKFRYLVPEVAVMTAISMEHMEFFKDMEAVAKEELMPLYFAQSLLVNVDDVDTSYLEGHNYRGYGFGAQLGYRIEDTGNNQLKVNLDGAGEVNVPNPMLGAQGAKTVAAAAATAHMLGWDADSIHEGLTHIGQVAGRMQKLNGINDSIIYDDTYNSSPIAVNAALDVLYGANVMHRIAVLGSMNELGADSQVAHEEVGQHCDPAKLDCVITIGDLAKQYLAPVAKSMGCQVASFMSPVEAGNFIKERIEPSSAVLVKGSQNKVFAEETVKILLANKEDAKLLVRQSPEWMAKKRLQFPEISA